MTCPPIPFNPITCQSPLHFCFVSLNSSSILDLQALPSLHHSVGLYFISQQLELWISYSFYIWTHSLPHPQAYAVFMSVQSLHHPGIRSGMFVSEISWGLLVIIVGIKQVSATNCCTGDTLSCNIPAFIWLPTVVWLFWQQIQPKSM